jgi:DnaJ like chaperone protein
MALSPPEIAAIVIGLGGGYWLVSRIIEGSKRPDWKPEDFGTGPSSGPRPEEPSKDATSDAPRPWWEVLGVPRIATRDEVARAYKRKISEYHPDKVAQMGPEIRALAEHRSKEINAAYDEATRGL